MKDRIAVITIFVVLFSMCFACVFYILASDDIRKIKEARNIVVLTKKADSLEITDKSLNDNVINKQKVVDDLTSSILNIEEEMEGANMRLSKLGD